MVQPLTWLRWTSWLFWLNWLFVQWTFTRIVRVTDRKTGRVARYELMTCVVPLTGWWSDYRRFRIEWEE